ncbi:hypothetical protein BO71DRAFT_319920, partial [Aspergillus ellipticus CBS 707.79]
ILPCPKSIHDSDLSEKDQKLLEYKLQGVKGRIPQPVWDKLKQQYNIVKEDWLV